MWFHLCRNQPMEAAITSGEDGVNSLPASFYVEATPYNDEDADEEVAEFWNVLKRLNDESGEGQPRLLCEIFLPDNGVWIGFRIVSGPVTTAITEVFGGNARIQVGISGFTIINSRRYEQAGTSKMKLRTMEHYACEDPYLLNFVFLPNLENELECNSVLTFEGVVTVRVSLEEELAELDTTDDTVVKRVYRRMLERWPGSDLVIIPENGVKVKAHQNMLAAHSNVFNAMFETNMKKGRKTLEMPEMSEAGVQALLPYLYYKEEIVVNAEPPLAFEMLQVGYKYNMPVLEKEMKNLFLDKPAEWFDVDLATKLFMFAKNLPPEHGDCLKQKAIQVLKTNSDKLMESPAYTTLINEDPNTAMELRAYGFGGQN